MKITIRPLENAADGRLIEKMIVAAWDSDANDAVPSHVSVALAKENGGVILLAFVDGEPVGFCWGFWSWDKALQRWKCASHLAGVIPEYRGRGYKIGEQLKWAQRQAVLDQGFDLMTWTFDPFETRNGTLNMRKLGAFNNQYYRNLYGKLDRPLERDLPTDRFVATWELNSPAVIARANGTFIQPTWETLQEQKIRVLNVADSTAVLPRPIPLVEPDSLISDLDGAPFLLALPRDFAAIKQQNSALAKAWHGQMRPLFERSFEAGYTAVNLLSHGEESDLCVYLLQNLSTSESKESL